MQSKKKREEYSKARKHKKDLLKTPLYRGVNDVKKLEKHIADFIKAVKKDSKFSDKEIAQQVKLFEEELHAEAREMKKELSTGLNHLVQGMLKLAELKEVIEEHTGIKHPLRDVFSHEDKLAKALLMGIEAKLDSLEKMFKRLG